MPQDSDTQINTKTTLLSKLINRFLKLFFKYLYNEMAWIYNWVAYFVSFGKWNTWIETSLGHIEGHKILELGHGPGHLLVKLMLTGRQVYGLDSSKHMTKIASARLNHLSLPINLTTAHAQQLPFPTDEFDQIVATFPTEYIMEEDTWMEIRRVLKTGGSVVILPAAYPTGTSLIEKSLAWLYRITGQAPLINERTIEPLNKYGFELNLHEIYLKNSIVMIILAKKTTDDKN